MTYVRPGVSTTISFHPTEGWRIALSGDLDANAEHTLSSLAWSLCKDREDSVDLDLSGVTSVDAAGWAAVASIAAEVRQAGCSAKIINPSPAVRQLTDQITFQDEGSAAERRFTPAA